MSRAALLLVIAVVCAGHRSEAQIPEPGPIVIVETAKGTLALETYPEEAPAAVAHVVALVRRRFYDGQRVHRAIPGFVVQFGDPQTRAASRRDLWGRGPEAGSGTPVGVAEFDARRTHRRGAVGMAHLGDPAKADSQVYITLAPRPELDGRYVVFGQVIAGLDVPSRLEVGDEIRRVYIRE